MHSLRDQLCLTVGTKGVYMWNGIASRSASYSSMQYVLNLLEVVEFVSYFVPTESFEASSCIAYCYGYTYYICLTAYSTII